MEEMYLVSGPRAPHGQLIWATSAEQAANRFRILFNLPTTTAVTVSKPGR